MPDIYVNKQSSVKSDQSSRQSPITKHQLPGHTHNPLASFCYLPDRVNFETQEKEEKVVLFLRKHIITNVPWVLLAALFILAPFILSVFPLLSSLPEKFQMVAIIFWYLVTLAFILESFFTWFFNIYILTDERVVDIDFYNLIYREISDAKIDKIQDVTFNVGGVARTLFNYGDVFIQTAGTIPNFEFQAVPDPARVAKILQELRTEEEIEALEGRAR